ncbi:hypothetical protein [Cryobacterium tepidiphilum]|jgi:hypothetical protein|uniref:Uncharacterized protein n=1 Tax=Cryobacterium tepidiphilum TaxID=2486026 RepID=A0A3M8L9I0_9MICO|nr:hypothetical protein [Cryobacterium tepidiphilum]RNE62096.1 hypothetical protein EEJ31_09230 [Cryobacterium tepidiphilum]
MKRVEVHYQGRIYSIPDTSMESVRDTVDHALRGSGSHWLQVQNGEGLGQDAFILITPGIPISIVNPTPSGTSDLGQSDNEASGGGIAIPDLL